MGRPPDLSEDDRVALLRSLTAVGPTKPVGYLPLHTIEAFAQVSTDVVVAAAVARGLTTAQFGPSACCIKSGALYVYDRDALAALLRANADVVCGAGLPLDPDNFVARIAVVWFDESHPAHPVVVAAFGGSA